MKGQRSLTKEVVIYFDYNAFPLCLTSYARRVKTFAEASQLFTPAASNLVDVRKISTSYCIVEGPKWVEVEGANL
jgi:hypothetical protein